MDKKIDRRILRTQQQLKEALFDLAAYQTPDGITVKQLTDHAGLNRGTFYLHYQGMDEFFEQLKEEILDEYYAIIKKLAYTTQDREPFTDPPAGFVRPFQYICEHQRFFTLFMGSAKDGDFAQRLTELLKQQFQYSYLAKNPHKELHDIPVKQLYLFAYMASAYVGCIKFWIQRHFDVSPSEMAILFSEISRLGSAQLYDAD
ncbi:TetR/AcrR family transcriptional regulator [Paenibacillus wenxiniae]|uniref:TetR/AcrR family transcriptional regulator n=1 Tax=Paenibacillus wenxiniae TaxID=1636843 RepID=A0ABW4RDJ7_9BACL